MSAPDTNVKIQEKKHAPSLFGIKASIVYGVGLLTLFAIYVVVTSGNDEAGVAGDDSAGSSMVEGETEASTLEGYEADTYAPGGNATGTVSATGTDGN
ncbi:hypothetical protein [Roseivivax sp. CAU 1753]